MPSLIGAVSTSISIWPRRRGRSCTPEQEAIDAEITELTGGKVTSINQVAKLSALLVELGHDVTDLTKKSVGALLAHKPEGDVKRLLELRQEGAQSAARKLDSLARRDRCGSADARHAALPRRFYGALERHPLPAAKSQKGEDRESRRRDRRHPRRRPGTPAPDRCAAGDRRRRLPQHDHRRTRACADRRRLLGESNPACWPGSPARRGSSTSTGNSTRPAIQRLEPYCVTASRILKRAVTPEDEAGRQIGKTCDLAFGYGGGLGAWRRFDSSDTYTDAQIENFKAKWRSTHAATVRFWRALENSLRRAVTHRKARHSRQSRRRTHRQHALPDAAERPAAGLPQGATRSGQDSTRRRSYFKDNGRGGWSEIRGWYGTFTENVVQAIARDLLAAAMLRLEAAGYPIVLHVHDEAVAEVPEGFGSTDEFLRANDDAAGVGNRTCRSPPSLGRGHLLSEDPRRRRRAIESAEAQWPAIAEKIVAPIREAAAATSRSPI